MSLVAFQVRIIASQCGGGKPEQGGRADEIDSRRTRRTKTSATSAPAPTESPHLASPTRRGGRRRAPRRHEQGRARSPAPTDGRDGSPGRPKSPAPTESPPPNPSLRSRASSPPRGEELALPPPRRSTPRLCPPRGREMPFRAEGLRGVSYGRLPTTSKVSKIWPRASTSASLTSWVTTQTRNEPSSGMATVLTMVPPAGPQSTYRSYAPT
jgi:hypothetical protein